MVTIKNKTKHKVPTDQFHFCKFLTYLFHMPFPASLQDLLKNINNNKIRPSFFYYQQTSTATLIRMTQHCQQMLNIAPLPHCKAHSVIFVV